MIVLCGGTASCQSLKIFDPNRNDMNPRTTWQKRLQVNSSKVEHVDHGRVEAVVDPTNHEVGCSISPPLLCQLTM